MPPSAPSLGPAIIFDLDGVLVSSIPAHFEAFRRTFAEQGRSFTYEEYVRLGAGASRDVLIRRVMGDELSPETFDVMMRAKVEHVTAYIRERGLDAIPGAHEFVERARAQGWPLAVATASRTPDLLLDGAGLGGLFDVVVSRDDVERTKPAPDLYLRAATDLGVDPAHCVVIEDSPAGIASGVAAGMRVIALTTSEPPPRLSQADEIVDGFDAIDLDAWRERLRGNGD